MVAAARYEDQQQRRKRNLGIHRQRKDDQVNYQSEITLADLESLFAAGSHISRPHPLLLLPLLSDVGLAIARNALDTSSHYFEVTIVDPGENCYIAVGLVRKNYPKKRHPGWNKGSIAYHADDGKLFTGEKYLG